MLRDERFYPSFRQNALYVRMLAELDMLKDPSFRGSDDGDGGRWHTLYICVYVCICVYSGILLTKKSDFLDKVKNVLAAQI